MKIIDRQTGQPLDRDGVMRLVGNRMTEEAFYGHAGTILLYTHEGKTHDEGVLAHCALGREWDSPSVDWMEDLFLNHVRVEKS